MIRKPTDIQSGEKRIRLLIAGYPGIGKSTVALSCKNPRHIDCDFGIDRIEPRYRKPYIQPQSYDEILADLTPENLKDFDSLVFDTGGKLVTLISQWAMKKDPKYGQRDGSLSLKGYGAVGKEFQRLMDYCFYELKKHIVMVFHAVEEKDGDNTRLRIKVEGQTKNNVWEPMDLGGFMEMHGNERTIGFSNCERYFAKGTRGIQGTYAIPTLTDGMPNDFLEKLFAEYNASCEREMAELEEMRERYEAVMREGREIIAGIHDAQSANALLPKMSALTHALTSEAELRHEWGARCRELGLVWDKASRSYRGGTPAAGGTGAAGGNAAAVAGAAGTENAAAVATGPAGGNAAAASGAGPAGTGNAGAVAGEQRNEVNRECNT